MSPDFGARYRRLMLFFAGLTTNIAFWDVLLPIVGLRALSRRTRSNRYRRIAASFKTMAIQMGGVMIKVGQFLSARLDVMPEEVTRELADLQDEVPAEDFQVIRRLAEDEFGASLETLFEGFEPVPLAAASLGQVHRARLPAGAAEHEHLRDVVVKIQRPTVRQLIEVDFSALRRFGGWLQTYKPIRERVDVLALIGELSDTVHQETDYLAEGQNADAFRSNFSGRPNVRVPRVIWSRTTRRVLTLEDVYSIKITAYGAIDAAGISRKEVASSLFSTYLQQIFEDRFFHADPHPGNLFVNPLGAKEAGNTVPWELTFVDFGMVGRVPAKLRQGLREMLVGVGTRDAGRVVRAYQILGVLLPTANTQLLEQAEAQLFDRFWGLSMAELRRIGHAEMHQFAQQFRELMLSMPFQVPHNLLLLGRALAILSGMCTGLDPEFNVWSQLAPYAQKLVVGEKASEWQVWRDQLGDMLKLLLTLPRRADVLLDRLERWELRIIASEEGAQSHRLESAINGLFGGLVFAALLFAGVLLYGYAEVSAAFIMWILAASALLWSLLRRSKGSR